MSDSPTTPKLAETGFSVTVRNPGVESGCYTQEMQERALRRIAEKRRLEDQVELENQYYQVLFKTFMRSVRIAMLESEHKAAEERSEGKTCPAKAE